MPHSLPDDHRHWPEDPFALLGVERGADDAAIRAAYTRLIRTYKPEHHPDEFGKIREAYEICRRQAVWYRRESEEAPAEPIKVPADAEALANLPLPPLRSAVEPDAVEVLWGRAIEGDLAGAYRGLASEARDRGSVDLSLRLYWLLTFDPKLDSDRTRHTWLGDALARSRLQGSALELYRRELDADPNSALAEPYTGLFDLPACPAEFLMLANFVVPAAARAARFSLIEELLPKVKRRIGTAHDAAWLSLLGTVIDWAVWSHPNPALAYGLRELAPLKHLELQHEYVFDRIDQARHWGEECLRFHPRLAKFVRLIGILWASRTRVGRAELAEGLSPIASQPYAYLSDFDDHRSTLGSGFGLIALELLSRCMPYLEGTHSPDILRGCIRRVLPNIDGSLDAGWGALRAKLLDWMVFDRITAEELAEACAADTDWRIRTIAGNLRTDISLRLVWLASCLVPNP